ncbi:MAG TPA: HD domain-containing protein [Anaerolineae bacterium]|nr:HD domain-containing protein [Anaerolineae bacterium]
MEVYSDRYEAALSLAARAHHDQVRKVGGDPYVVHVVAVSIILIHHGFSEDVAIAGLLHDVVEDQDLPLAAIDVEFGSDVAEMVDALTERKREGDVDRPWEVRKRESLERLRAASLEAVAVKAADTLHNVRSVALGLRRQGPSIWRSFNRGAAETLWYYRNVAAIGRERMGAHPLVDELEAAINRLESSVAEANSGEA